MALGEKYRIHADHQFGGYDRYIQIFVEGYASSVSELTSARAPGILEYPGNDNDIFDPIYGSELEVTLISLTAEQWIEFATAKNREYLAKIYNEDTTQTEWQGWLVPSEYEEPHNQAPYTTTLIFNCGLGPADGKDYLNAGAYFTGRVDEIEILTNCLKLIYPDTLAGTHRPDLRVAIGVAETTMTTAMTTGPLELAFVDQEKYIREDGTVWSVQAVIRDIITSYGARILMGVSGWWIVRIRDYALWYDGYEMPYQLYTEEGVYSAQAGLDSATAGVVIAGPADRSSMVGWMGGTQMVRYERAYKEIKLKQWYEYMNLFLLGTFNSENWTDFWTAAGAYTRVQSNDNENEYYIRITSTGTISQEIDNILPVSPGNNLIFSVSFAFMMEYLDTVTHTNFRIAVEVDFDTASTDYSLDGEIGGASPSDPAWAANTSSLVYFNYSDMKPGVWRTVELAIPDPPTLQGNLRVKFAIGDATGGAGSIDATSYKKMVMLPSYGTAKFPSTNVAQFKDYDIEVSDDNIDTSPEHEVRLGDVAVDTNEGVFFRGSKTTNSSGLTPTILWRTSRRNGAVRAGVGPDVPLAELVQDGLITQHGKIRKRLTGRLVLDHAWWGMLLIQEESVWYVPTKMAIDLKRGEVDISMVELSPMGVKIIELETLVTGWTNTNWDVFTSTGPVITSMQETSAPFNGSGFSNTIAYGAHEKFVVEVVGVTDLINPPTLTWGAAVEVVEAGDTVLMEPGTTAGTASIVISNESGAASINSQVHLTVTKAYGY